jgi:hypothetical protein
MVVAASENFLPPTHSIYPDIPTIGQNFPEANRFAKNLVKKQKGYIFG